MNKNVVNKNVVNKKYNIYTEFNILYFLQGQRLIRLILSYYFINFKSVKVYLPIVRERLLYYRFD